MTNLEKARLLRSAASALEHGRFQTARNKLRKLWQTTELYDLITGDVYTDAYEYTSRVDRIKELLDEPLLIEGPTRVRADDEEDDDDHDMYDPDNESYEEPGADSPPEITTRYATAQEERAWDKEKR